MQKRKEWGNSVQYARFHLFAEGGYGKIDLSTAEGKFPFASFEKEKERSP